MRAGAGTPALLLLQREGVPHRVHAYSAGPGPYGPAAAAALGVAPERLLKTLIADVDDRLACAVVPAAAALDLKALAAALGGRRAALAEPARAERSTGGAVGGISPLAQRTALRTVVDASATGFDTVLVSAGRRGLSVELAPADLVRLTGAVLAPLTREL